jgi:hypothetical protein
MVTQHLIGKTSVEVDKIKLLEPKKREWRRQDLFGCSIIDPTIQELEDDADFQDTQTRYQTLGAEGVTKEERTQRQRALTNLGIQPFAKFLGQELNNNNKPHVLHRKTSQVLQINIGLHCNQACARQSLRVNKDNQPQHATLIPADPDDSSVKLAVDGLEVDDSSVKLSVDGLEEVPVGACDGAGACRVAVILNSSSAMDSS